MVRVPLCEVQVAKPVHRADEGLGIAGCMERKVIGLTLDVARPSIREGQGYQSKGHEDESEQRQSTQICAAMESEPTRSHVEQLIGCPERGQRDGALHEKS